MISYVFMYLVSANGDSVLCWPIFVTSLICIPYSGKFSGGKIFVEAKIIASSW